MARRVCSPAAAERLLPKLSDDLVSLVIDPHTNPKTKVNECHMRGKKGRGGPHNGRGGLMDCGWGWEDISKNERKRYKSQLVHHV
jgi:hypothetical protein